MKKVEHQMKWFHVKKIRRQDLVRSEENRIKNHSLRNLTLNRTVRFLKDLAILPDL